MVCPPLPWLSPDIGAHLLRKTEFIRSASLVSEQDKAVRNCRIQSLYPVMDGLNVLSLPPWTINKRMLQVALEVFQRDEREKKFPRPLKRLIPPYYQIKAGMSEAKRGTLMIENKHWGIYCYALAVANHVSAEFSMISSSIEPTMRMFQF